MYETRASIGGQEVHQAFTGAHHLTPPPTWTIQDMTSLSDIIIGPGQTNLLTGGLGPIPEPGECHGNLAGIDIVPIR